jgi:kynurenine formamidase
MSTYAISLDVVKTIMKQKKIEAKAGDILIMRSGWTKWYDANTSEERLKKVTHGDAWVGMEVTERSLEWLWDNRFAAVAGDSIGFEVTPIGCCGKYSKFCPTSAVLPVDV